MYKLALGSRNNENSDENVFCKADRNIYNIIKMTQASITNYKK